MIVLLKAVPGYSVVLTLSVSRYALGETVSRKSRELFGPAMPFSSKNRKVCTSEISCVKGASVTPKLTDEATRGDSQIKRTGRGLSPGT